MALFLPGAFAGWPDQLREAFAAHSEVELAIRPFAPSGDLAQEILSGEAADVFVSANTRFMLDVHNAGLAPQPRVLAGNLLTLVATKDAASKFNELTDFARDDLRVVAPQPRTDPCGQYVAALFEQVGLTEALEKKRASGGFIHSHGSADLPGYLLDGRADTGILYHSETVGLSEELLWGDLPPERNFADKIAFTIAAIARPGVHIHPGATAFIDFMTGPAGQDLLVSRGFLPASAVTAPIPW